MDERFHRRDAIQACNPFSASRKMNDAPSITTPMAAAPA
jgi:hypothetical protein